MAENDDDSFEDIELTEMEDRPEYQDPVLDLSFGSQRERPALRERLQERWTRVISLSKDKLGVLVGFELAPDLLLGDGMAIDS